MATADYFSASLTDFFPFEKIFGDIFDRRYSICSLKNASDSVSPDFKFLGSNSKVGVLGFIFFLS